VRALSWGPNKQTKPLLRTIRESKGRQNTVRRGLDPGISLAFHDMFPHKGNSTGRVALVRAFRNQAFRQSHARVTALSQLDAGIVEGNIDRGGVVTQFQSRRSFNSRLDVGGDDLVEGDFLFLGGTILVGGFILLTTIVVVRLGFGRGGIFRVFLIVVTTITAATGTTRQGRRLDRCAARQRHIDAFELARFFLFNVKFDLDAGSLSSKRKTEGNRVSERERWYGSLTGGTTQGTENNSP
jgi:hypothetical protein